MKIQTRRRDGLIMVEAVETMDGWYVLHDLRKVDWAKWKNASEEERNAALKQFEAHYQAWDENEQKNEGSYGIFHIVGQKADLMITLLRPTLEEILAEETAFNKSALAEFLIPTESYMSVVELSKYRSTVNGVDPETLPETQARLKPILEKWDYVSFYPMSRKRDLDDNWYTLEKDIRGKLLYEHSLTGRKYAGKVKQIITGSTGLDEWEWGVTLFAHDYLELKKIVYEMRYDTATARYGLFGDFYTGRTLTLETFKDIMQV